jgi:hypothetical protein
VAEYLHRSSPIVIDSDSDGLSDLQEISTYSTNPAKADSDGDQLNDGDEALTHHSDPRNADSDGDGYTDFDEVLYGGNPNDPSGVPQPIVNYSESFENNAHLAAWTTPQQSVGDWAIDSTVGYSGSSSFRSGAIGGSQFSSVRFRGFFSAGQLSFYAKLDAANCCDRLYLMIDGVQVLSMYAATQWSRYSVPIVLGVHDVEWQYHKESFNVPGTGAAWIDDVAFVKQ